MQCGVEERVVRGARREVVRCFKCREEGHKCRGCLLWEKKVKRVARPNERKAHQKEKRREVRRVKEGEAACPVKGKAQPREAKTQQSSAWSGELERAAREGGSRKEVRRTFKILREVWLNIGVEKIDTHEGVMIKALLDSGATGMFMDRQTAARHGFKLQKLERPLMVKNVDGTEQQRGYYAPSRVQRIL